MSNSGKIMFVFHHASKIEYHPGKVEKFGGGVNEGEPEGDESIDGAGNQAIKNNPLNHCLQELYKYRGQNSLPSMHRYSPNTVDRRFLHS